MADLAYCDLYKAITNSKDGYWFDYDLSDDGSPPTQLVDFGGFGQQVTATLTTLTAPGPYFWANDPEQPKTPIPATDPVWLWCGLAGTDGQATTFRLGLSELTRLSATAQIWLLVQWQNPASWPSGGMIHFRSHDGLSIAGIYSSTDNNPLENRGREALASFYNAANTCSRFVPAPGSPAVWWEAIPIGDLIGPSTINTSGFCTGLLEITVPGAVKLALSIQAFGNLSEPPTWPPPLAKPDSTTNRTRGSFTSWDAAVVVNGTTTPSAIQLPASTNPTTLASAIRWWQHGSPIGGGTFWIAPVTHCPGETGIVTNYLEGNYEVEETYHVLVQNMSNQTATFALLAIPQIVGNGNTATNTPAYLNLYDLTFNLQNIPINPQTSETPIGTPVYYGADWFNNNSNGNAKNRQIIRVATLTIPGCAYGDLFYTTVVANNSQGYFDWAIVPIVPNACVSSMFEGVLPPVPGCSSYTSTTLTYSHSATQTTTATCSTTDTTSAITISGSATISASDSGSITTPVSSISSLSSSITTHTLSITIATTATPAL